MENKTFWWIYKSYFNIYNKSNNVSYGDIVKV